MRVRVELANSIVLFWPELILLIPSLTATGRRGGENKCVLVLIIRSTGSAADVPVLYVRVLEYLVV